jgi:transcriptional regulator with XRE-family HTH domain
MPGCGGTFRLRSANDSRPPLEMKISQEALAERASLHRNYVGGVERGERDLGITALGQLANALGLSLAEFFQPFRQR